jgi:hypothetical protein
MNKNKLRKQLEKYYWSHNQNIIVDTWESMEGNERDCSFDIYLAGTDISLFTIQNYNGLKDSDLVHHSYLTEPKFQFLETWDGVKASCIPLYMNGIITLKTFKPIIQQDIINATNYFIDEVLKAFPFFNIKFNIETKE